MTLSFKTVLSVFLKLDGKAKTMNKQIQKIILATGLLLSFLSMTVHAEQMGAHALNGNFTYNLTRAPAQAYGSGDFLILSGVPNFSGNTHNMQKTLYVTVDGIQGLFSVWERKYLSTIKNLKPGHSGGLPLQDIEEFSMQRDVLLAIGCVKELRITMATIKTSSSHGIVYVFKARCRRKS